MTYLPGEILLEKYRIETLLGQGAFGDVYRVTNLAVNAPRAVKVLRRDAPGMGSADYKERHRRFQLEAQLGAQLNSSGEHPNLLQIHDWMEGGQQGEQLLVLEMAYASGGNLAERLAKNLERGESMPIAQALRIALDVAEGLAVLHARNIVHRDLKPANILFKDQDCALIADLGLAQIPDGLSMRSRISNAAMHPGTPGYMSPEQENTRGILKPPSDLYALGLILFEMLTGRKYAYQRPGTLAGSFRPETPAWLEAQLARMLAKPVEDRPWDGTEAARLLREDLQKLSPADGKLTQPDVPDPGRGFPPGNVPRLDAPGRTPGLDLGEGVLLELVRIPAGEFWMGSGLQTDAHIGQDELPRHRVYLEAYFIGKNPVSNRQYAQFLRATGHRAPASWKKGAIPPGREKYPVVDVSWEDAQGFCKWASQVTGQPVRLPTEAEWEYAGRGTDGRLYPWGNQEPDAGRCNHGGHVRDTTPAGRYSPQGDSPFACADMAGNVWEWCSDWYDAKYYRKSPGSNPPGPSAGLYRVMRGGSWMSRNPDLRMTARDGGDPLGRFSITGFRCACDGDTFHALKSTT